MIVTKAQAQKFLIRKSCWIVTTDDTGNYSMAYTTIHWKEGMEVFESQEDCYAEVQRLVEIKMKSGNCPRCNFQRVDESQTDLSYLNVIDQPKGALVYRCKNCHTVWFKQPSSPKAKAYDSSLLEYLKEWAQEDLAPSREFQNVLDEIGDISTNKDSLIYPAHIILKNGFESENALIHLEKQPPPASWFSQNNWYYLNQVQEIRRSRFAYPHGIAKKMMQLFTGNTSEQIFIRDIETQKIYEFDMHAGIFMPIELSGQSFEWIGTHRPDYKTKTFRYFEPDERGHNDHWLLTKPPQVTHVWGDY